MSYLRIKTIVHSSEDIDFSDLSSIPSLPAYIALGSGNASNVVHINSSEFLATSAGVQLFPNSTSALNVRDCIIQATSAIGLVTYFNGVAVLNTPPGATTTFTPVSGAASQLLYTIKPDGVSSTYVRVISTTFEGYGSA